MHPRYRLAGLEVVMGGDPTELLFANTFDAIYFRAETNKLV